MSLRRALAAILLAAACGAGAAEAPRAIWTWEPESYAMLDSDAAADAAVAFFRRQHINTVLLYADAYDGRNLIASHPERYRRLIARLRAEGITAQALIGSAFLHTERYVLPGQRAPLMAAVQRVLDYNAQAAPHERFSGISLDIEPHILDEWDQQRERLLLGFLDMGGQVMERVRASGQRLAVGPAIPFWLDGIPLEWRGARKPASEHAQDIFDYVALMDYRDHAAGPDGMIAHAADEMAYAERVGKTVIIGVETSPNELSKVTFDHLSPADLERELALVEQAFAQQRAFGGFALHHYASYRRWLQRTPRRP